MRYDLKSIVRFCSQFKRMEEKVTAPSLRFCISSYIVLEKRLPNRMLILEKAFTVDIKKTEPIKAPFRLLLKAAYVGEARKLREKLSAYASEVHFFEMLNKALSHSENWIEI